MELSKWKNMLIQLLNIAGPGPVIGAIAGVKFGRAAFYGMMIAEGVIAMIWAAAALSIYNIAPENLALPPAQVLANAVNHHLGRGFGMLTVAGVIILIITSGDTGLRSLRMIAAKAVVINVRMFE